MQKFRAHFSGAYYLGNIGPKSHLLTPPTKKVIQMGQKWPQNVTALHLGPHGYSEIEQYFYSIRPSESFLPLQHNAATAVVYMIQQHHQRISLKEEISTPHLARLDNEKKHFPSSFKNTPPPSDILEKQEGVYSQPMAFLSIFLKDPKIFSALCAENKGVFFKDIL